MASRPPQLRPTPPRLSLSYPRDAYFSDFFHRYWLWVAIHTLVIHSYTLRIDRGWTSDDTAQLLWDVLPIHYSLKDSQMSERLREYLENELYAASPFFSSGETTLQGQLLWYLDSEALHAETSEDGRNLASWVRCLDDRLHQDRRSCQIRSISDILHEVAHGICEKKPGHSYAPYVQQSVPDDNASSQPGFTTTHRVSHERRASSAMLNLEHPRPTVPQSLLPPRHEPPSEPPTVFSPRFESHSDVRAGPVTDPKASLPKICNEEDPAPFPEIVSTTTHPKSSKSFLPRTATSPLVSPPPSAIGFSVRYPRNSVDQRTPCLSAEPSEFTGDDIRYGRTRVYLPRSAPESYDLSGETKLDLPYPSSPQTSTTLPPIQTITNSLPQPLNLGSGIYNSTSAFRFDPKLPAGLRRHSPLPSDFKKILSLSNNLSVAIARSGDAHGPGRMENFPPAVLVGDPMPVPSPSFAPLIALPAAVKSQTEHTATRIIEVGTGRGGLSSTTAGYTTYSIDTARSMSSHGKGKARHQPSPGPGSGQMSQSPPTIPESQSSVSRRPISLATHELFLDIGELFPAYNKFAITPSLPADYMGSPCGKRKARDPPSPRPAGSRRVLQPIQETSPPRASSSRQPINPPSLPPSGSNVGFPCSNAVVDVIVSTLMNKRGQIKVMEKEELWLTVQRTIPDIRRNVFDYKIDIPMFKISTHPTEMTTMVTYDSHFDRDMKGRLSRARLFTFE